MKNAKNRAVAVPLAIQFRSKIDETSIVDNPRMTNMTSEGGRVTGYDD